MTLSLQLIRGTVPSKINSHVCRTPDMVDSVFQDSDEEEIFFGSVSEKEQTGTFSK
jgi:hypothetical protein